MGPHGGAQQLVEKFGGEKFHLWKLKMRMLLEDKDLWDIVTGEEERPDEDVGRAQLFDKRARKAHATIVLNFKDSQLMHVSSASSAREVWERLQDLYEAKGLANRLFLRRKLFTCQMSEGDTMIAHVNKVKAMGEQLEAIGAGVSDDDLVMTLLSSLPESYGGLIVALESRADDLSLEFVISRLLHEETKRVEKSHVGGESAFVAKHVLTHNMQRETARLLGCPFGVKVPANARYASLMEMLRRKLRYWSSHHLSLAGRAMVVNQVLLASLWYVAACWCGTKKQLDQIRSLVRNYLWGGADGERRSPARVAWATVIAPKSEGGLGILDVELQVQALLAKWVTRCLRPGGGKWRAILLHRMAEVGPGPMSGQIWNRGTSWAVAAHSTKMRGSRLMRCIWSAWRKVAEGLRPKPPSGWAEVVRQPLFWNSAVVGEDNKVLGSGLGNEWQARWARVGVTQVKNLWDKSTAEWRIAGDFEQWLPHSEGREDELRQLIAAIPSAWEDILRQGKATPKEGEWWGDFRGADGGEELCLDAVYHVTECGFGGSVVGVEYDWDLEGAAGGDEEKLERVEGDDVDISTCDLKEVRVLEKHGKGLRRAGTRPRAPAKKAELSRWSLREIFRGRGGQRQAHVRIYSLTLEGGRVGVGVVERERACGRARDIPLLGYTWQSSLATPSRWPTPSAVAKGYVCKVMEACGVRADAIAWHTCGRACGGDGVQSESGELHVATPSPRACHQ